MSDNIVTHDTGYRGVYLTDSEIDMVAGGTEHYTVICYVDSNGQNVCIKMPAD